MLGCKEPSCSSKHSDSEQETTLRAEDETLHSGQIHSRVPNIEAGLIKIMFPGAPC